MQYSSRLSTRWLAASILLTITTYAAAQEIEVYKRPTCSCCAKWIEHLQANGFTPKVYETPKLDPINDKFNVPQKLRSCHTALIDGYVIEGHVPADLIRKIIKERPDAIGLTVPSMAPGSPGMEGAFKTSYSVLLMKRDGGTSLYANR